MLVPLLTLVISCATFSADVETDTHSQTKDGLTIKYSMKGEELDLKFEVDGKVLPTNEVEVKVTTKAGKAAVQTVVMSDNSVYFVGDLNFRGAPLGPNGAAQLNVTVNAHGPTQKSVDFKFAVDEPD